MSNTASAINNDMPCQHARFCEECYTSEHVERRNKHIEALERQIQEIHDIATGSRYAQWVDQISQIAKVCEDTMPRLRKRENK